MRIRGLLAFIVLVIGIMGPVGHALAAEQVGITIGGAGTLQYLPLEVGHALGYFREQGLDVDLQYVKSGTHAATALLTGGVDFSGNALDHAVKAALQGKSLKAIAAFTEVPGNLLVMASRYRDAVREIRDLKGRPIGVTAFGASTHMNLSYVLARSGLEPGEINAVPVGAEGLVAALENGRVQGIMTAGLIGARLLETGRGFVLFDLRARAATEALFGGPYLNIGLLTRSEVMAERPERCAKVVRAVVKATRWIASHSAAEIVAVLPKTVVLDRRLYLAALEENRDGFSKTGRIDPRAVETVVTAHRAFGAIPEGQRVDPAALYDNRFVDQALAGGS